MSTHVQFHSRYEFPENERVDWRRELAFNTEPKMPDGTEEEHIITAWPSAGNNRTFPVTVLIYSNRTQQYYTDTYRRDGVHRSRLDEPRTLRVNK